MALVGPLMSFEQCSVGTDYYMLLVMCLPRNEPACFNKQQLSTLVMHQTPRLGIPASCKQ